MIEVCAFFKEYTEIQITTEYTLLLNAMSVNLHFAVGKGHSGFYRVQSAHKYDLCVCLFLLCAEVKADCGDIIKKCMRYFQTKHSNFSNRGQNDFLEDFLMSKI